MLLSPTITAAPETEPALDQKQLYALGLDHVRRLSRRLWTDHNLHDPGITTLELLCYALTDLAYRSRFSVEDLLATSADNAANMAAQFFTPRQILPNRPLTERDYRKLLIDLPNVKNAWVYPVTPVLFADTRRAQLLREDNREPTTRPVPIRGQYGVRFEYMDHVTSQIQKDEVCAAADELLQANRNLCEDFVAYEEVARQPYSLCAEIELAPDADQVEIAAQISFQVSRYLAPPVHCHGLSHMLLSKAEGGCGRSVAETFEGPVLQHGFIDDDELDAAALRSEVSLSDIISILMDIEGVRAVRDIVVSQLAWNSVTNQWDAVESENKWRLVVPEGKQPILSDVVERLVFYKKAIPVPAEASRVALRLAALNEAERVALETPRADDLPIPLGRARDTASYLSFQQHFPEVYGISNLGLPNAAAPERRAEALQLKGYLLFFDQVMANYFAQLSRVGSLFKRDIAETHVEGSDGLRTCFAQRVESIPDFEKVYAPGVDSSALAEILEDTEAALERRNRILDHLLARFAEDFHQTVDVMRSAFGTGPLTAAITKSRFLMDCPRLGAERSLAWNKALREPEALWNSSNVSGLERRLARLLGIGDFTRRNLGAVSYDLYAELDQTPQDEFRFRVRHPVTGKILLSSTTNYVTPEAARLELQVAIERAQLVEGYQRKVAVDGLHYFNIVDGSGNVVAQRKQRFTAEQLEAEIEALMLHLREYYSGEGMYLIENLMLLPSGAEASDDPLLPICVDAGCADCSDDNPYSYRVHVILPAYAGRFQNIEFRQFVERTIRREMPAHILPKICWANEVDMAQLEQAYREWIGIRTGVTHTDRVEKVERLVECLFKTKSVYPTQRLHDCGSDETKPPFILGRTALGTEDPGA
jgi:hypothetical protein